MRQIVYAPRVLQALHENRMNFTKGQVWGESRFLLCIGKLTEISNQIGRGTR